MPYELFYNFYPDLAERETRTLILPQPRGGLPADAYGLLEMYCNEPGCDCRRVFFMVVGERHEEPLAYVAYGWESREFYARWMHSDAPEDIAELQGPILNLASPQSKYAPALLRLIESVLLANPAYIERLKRHYRMVRERGRWEGPARVRGVTNGSPRGRPPGCAHVRAGLESEAGCRRAEARVGREDAGVAGAALAEEEAGAVRAARPSRSDVLTIPTSSLLPLILGFVRKAARRRGATSHALLRSALLNPGRPIPVSGRLA